MRASQSRLNEDEKCKRRYLWRYILDLEPKRDNMKMWNGKSVHLALAMHYNGGNEGDCVRAYEEKMDQFPHQDIESDFLGMKDLWVGRIKEYRDSYGKEDFEVLMVPEVEMTAPIGNEGDEIEAIIDLVIRKKDKSIWVVDHKTAARTGSSYWPQYFIDKQGTQYIHIVGHNFKEDVAGWMINVLKPTKTDYFEREQFTRTKLQLDAFRRQTAAQLKRIRARHAAIEHMPEWGDMWMEMADQHFPQYTHECHGFGTCSFLALCQTGKAGLPLFKNRERH